MFEAAYTEPGRKAEIAETSDLYAHTTYALIKLGRVSEALTQLEQGKTRLLSQALLLNEMDATHLPATQQDTLRRLRQTLRELETEMRLPAGTPARRDERELGQTLNYFRTELNDFIAHIRRAHPDFMTTGLNLTEILTLIPPDAALVAPIFTPQGSAVFIVPSGLKSLGLQQVLWANSFKDDDLQVLLRVLTDENKLGGWLGAYFNKRTDEAAWLDTIETTGQSLWSNLMGPIAERLANLNVTQVLLMPQGGLGLLPLHAAWHEVDGRRRYFVDDFAVTYLPSAYVHKVSLERMSNLERQGSSLLAVINPTNDLPFTPAEGEQVASLFEYSCATMLSGAEASPEAVMKHAMAAYLHFCCHGLYNWNDPMQSCLVLANHKPLTLSEIIGQLKLDNTRLVTLSACETGITDIRQSPDEYLGLPAGFLQAGAPAVLSTLWEVNDLSTMLLMDRFYQLHLRDKLEIPHALRQAQIWLREITARELAQRFADEEEKALNAHTRMCIETASDYFTCFADLAACHGREYRPYAHPYYWAAFTFSGA